MSEELHQKEDSFRNRKRKYPVTNYHDDEDDDEFEEDDDDNYEDDDEVSDASESDLFNGPAKEKHGLTFPTVYHSFDALLSKRLYSDAALALMVACERRQVDDPGPSEQMLTNESNSNNGTKSKQQLTTTLYMPPIIPLPRRLIGSLYHDQIVPTLLNRLQLQLQLQHQQQQRYVPQDGGSGETSSKDKKGSISSTKNMGNSVINQSQSNLRPFDPLHSQILNERSPAFDLQGSTRCSSTTFDDVEDNHIITNRKVASINVINGNLMESSRSNIQTVKTSPWIGKFRVCNCKRSNCLKLYCDCFASGLYCHFSTSHGRKDSSTPKVSGSGGGGTKDGIYTYPSCKCISCKNVPFPIDKDPQSQGLFNTSTSDMDPEKERREAILTILERNNHAFRPRAQVMARYTSAHSTSGEIHPSFPPPLIQNRIDYPVAGASLPPQPLSTTFPAGSQPPPPPLLSSSSTMSFTKTLWGSGNIPHSQHYNARPQVPLAPPQRYVPRPVESSSNPGTMTSTTMPSITNASPWLNMTKMQKMGCHCKKSSCLKKYCECFHAFMCCNPLYCKCLGCKNVEGNPTREEILKRKKKSLKPLAPSTSSPTVSWQDMKLGDEKNPSNTSESQNPKATSPPRSVPPDVLPTTTGLSNTIDSSVVYVHHPVFSVDTDPTTVMIHAVAKASLSSTTSRPANMLEAKVHVETDPFLPPSSFTIPATSGLLEFGKSGASGGFDGHPINKITNSSSLSQQVEATRMEKAWIRARQRIDTHTHMIQSILQQKEQTRFSGSNYTLPLTSDEGEWSDAQSLVDGMTRDMIRLQYLMEETGKETRVEIRRRRNDTCMEYQARDNRDEDRSNEVNFLTCSEELPWPSKTKDAVLSIEMEDQVVALAQEATFFHEMAKLIRRKALQLASDRVSRNAT